MSVNKVILIGHLGRDPEFRRTQAGDPVATFSLATSEHWRDKTTGERKEKTEWHNIVIFNENLIRIVEQYLRKGSKVYIEGQLQTRKWQDQQGNDRYSTEIVLKKFNGTLDLLDRAERSAPSENEYGTTKTSDYTTAKSGEAPPAARYGDLDDDIPF